MRWFDRFLIRLFEDKGKRCAGFFVDDPESLTDRDRLSI